MGKKRYVIYKDDLLSFLAEISRTMGKSGVFYNVSVKPHQQDSTKLVVIVG